MDDPVCIEALNQSAEWIPWLPVLGSVIVATVALIGVMISNKTNQDAIAAADARAQEDRADSRRRDSQAWARDSQREFQIWRRNTILKIAGDISGAALSAASGLQDTATHETSKADDAGALASFEEMSRSIQALSANLLIIGEPALAEMATSLSFDLRDKTLKKRVVDLNNIFRRIAEADAPPEMYAMRDDEREALVAQLEAVRASVGEFAKAARIALDATV